MGVAGVLLSQAAFDNIVAQCQYAKKEINSNMQRAISEVNNLFNTNRFVFVDVEFTDENAIFASDSFLWEFDLLGNVDDPQKENRVSLCSIYTDLDDRKFSELASTGHPNIKGRQRYIDKISSVI